MTMDGPKRPGEDKHLESRDRPRAKRRKTSYDGGEVAIYDEERVEQVNISNTDDDSDNDSVGLPSLDLFQWPAGEHDPLLPIPDMPLQPSSPSSHDSGSDSEYSSDSSSSSSSSSPALPFEGAVSPPFPWGSPAPFLPATFFPLPPLPGQDQNEPGQQFNQQQGIAAQPHPEPAPVPHHDEHHETQVVNGLPTPVLVPHHHEHHEAQIVMGLLTPAPEAELALHLPALPNDGFALPPPALGPPPAPGPGPGPGPGPEMDMLPILHALLQLFLTTYLASMV
ncbi:hypothetical protein B0H65DRAFT_442154 [Neurospora tetraspora]|uniref:Uncharacterized protein n=1 Tax=Neurospora tetraspora TaxID=94610 RepID=A0AAE0MRW9_9PEZI|nr:hypothetical protein B0H65DRAFT_442154 [Neurospora tetraspora]